MLNMEAMTMERPEFGSKVMIKATYQKKRIRPNTTWERKELPKPVEALYIGYRQVYDCKAYWWDEDGWELHRGEAHNLLLVVIGERRNPVYVAADDVEKVE